MLDPRIAAWLINPSDTVPSFECLIQKYFEKPCAMGTVNTDTGTLRNASVSSLFSIACGWVKRGRKWWKNCFFLHNTAKRKSHNAFLVREENYYINSTCWKFKEREQGRKVHYILPRWHHVLQNSCKILLQNLKIQYQCELMYNLIRFLSTSLQTDFQLCFPKCLMPCSVIPVNL